MKEFKCTLDNIYLVQKNAVKRNKENGRHVKKSKMSNINSTIIIIQNVNGLNQKAVMVRLDRNNV